MVHGKDMTPTWVVSSSLKIPEPKDLSLETSEDPCVSERRQRKWSAQCDVPVSYTHLTLPTILRV